MAVKSGPRDSKNAKRQAMAFDRELFTDVAVTLRRILQADAVAIVNMDEFQLFIRRKSTSAGRRSSKDEGSTSKEDIVAAVLHGKPWPAHVDPVINFVPKTIYNSVQVLGSDSNDDAQFRFNNPGSDATLGELYRTWLLTHRFWWDREISDETSQKVMSLMPDGRHTTLAVPFMTHDGKASFATFASWNRPPSTFGDATSMALIFARIFGNCATAALAIRKVRLLEQTRVAESNIQAQ